MQAAGNVGIRGPKGESPVGYCACAANSMDRTTSVSMSRNTITLRIIVAIAVFGVTTACEWDGGTDTSLASQNMAEIECEELIPEAVDIFEDESTRDPQTPRVLKLYEEEVREIARTSTRLDYAVRAKMSRGGEKTIYFNLEEDADGDRFSGVQWYER